ncbi:protein transporter tim10 [Cystobasidiomycetes sp. EMM_F5]
MLTRLCVEKCSNPAPQETYIKIREGLCLDRCVAKFFATNEAISEVMKKYQERQQSQAEATQQVQTATAGGFKGMFGL